jgi:propanol-preferring alcohol dehydrogenase
MLAAVLERSPGGETALRVGDRPVPVPGTGELRVRVMACAVCRTDLQIVDGDLAARALPLIPGHQPVGVVDAVGADVDGWNPGDRVAAGWLGGACGVCARCRAGRENLCAEAAFHGWTRDGGFAEFMLVRSDFAFRPPPGFSNVEAAPLLCGGVIGYRSLRISGIEPGQRLGLFGFGASASLALQVALHWQCEVFVATRSERERRRAIEMGARWAGGYDEPPPVPLDAAITFAPAGDVVIRALKALAPGGTVAINAIHLDRIPQFSYDDLWLERSLKSVANFTRADAREFLELAGTIPIRTQFDVMPLREAHRAFERVREGDVSGAIVLDVSAG